MLSRSALWRFAAALVIAAALTAWRVHKSASLYRVPSASMTPTIAAGEVVLVHSSAYRNARPRVHDIAVFSSPATGSVEYIKRVVADGGEIIEVHDHRLFKQRELIVEAYAHFSRNSRNVLSVPSAPLQRVPPQHFYALGDNRAESADSRVFGPVPYANLRGRAVAVVWPLHHARLLGP